MNKKNRGPKVVRKVGITAAVPVLAFGLCPLADEPPHTDVPDYSPVNPVGAFSINYVSSAAAHSRLFTIPTHHDHVPEQPSDFHFLMPSAFVASGQNVPFFGRSDDGSAILFQHWEARRRAHALMAADSTSMSAAVLWFASTEAKKP
jgi:hypothetical protein